jgi:hypothetical protein
MPYYRREELHKGLLALNFLKPSKVQGKSLPLMLSDPPTNMLAQSQSGTGKTAAFVTAILSRVDFSNPDQPQALALAPSRELARQIEEVIRAIGHFIQNLKIAPAVPGALPRGEPVRSAVVVGTPGTVMDIIRRRQLDVSQLKVLVLDEADNMLDQQGLGDQCMRVKRYVFTLHGYNPLPTLTRKQACCRKPSRLFSSPLHSLRRFFNTQTSSRLTRIHLSSSVAISQSRVFPRCLSIAPTTAQSMTFSAACMAS